MIVILLGILSVTAQEIPLALPWIVAVAGLLFLSWVISKLFFKSEKYIDERGYVVLHKENELEHRYKAKQVIGRELKPNEVVHHINGKRTDNDISNLCLMDRQKHEHFHAWLNWKKSKTHKYPSFEIQKIVLKEEYNGILLANFPQIEGSGEADETKPADLFPEYAPEHSLTKAEFTTKSDRSDLFESLRKERKRIAMEQKIKPYMIFDDKSLRAMVEMMPLTEEQMLQIKGIGQFRLRKYGSDFLAIIQSYKSNMK